MTRIWPDGLKRNCLWAVFPLFALDGLERRCHCDKWALNELSSFCRLCCWGLGYSNISVTVPVIHLMGPVAGLFWKNWTCSFTLRGHRSLAQWALSNCSFCFSCSSTSLWQIWCILTFLDGLERTVPCAGHPWRISAGDGRSAMIGVSHSWSNALA